VATARSTPAATIHRAIVANPTTDAHDTIIPAIAAAIVTRYTTEAAW